MGIILKSTKVYTDFFFMGHAFWKENIEDKIKLLGSNVLNCGNFPVKVVHPQRWFSLTGSIGRTELPFHFQKFFFPVPLELLTSYRSQNGGC